MLAADEILRGGRQGQTWGGGRATMSAPVRQRILVTGATGYIGGRLVPRLLEAGHAVRCVARNPNRLAGHPWPGVEIVEGNLADRDAAFRALETIEVAYYLIHSMAEGQTFLLTAWWISTMPGIALSVVVVCVGVFGDRVRDVLDPRMT